MATHRTYTVSIGPLAMMVFADPDSKMFLAHCLTTGTMAPGPTPRLAVKNLRTAVEDEIDYHVHEGNLSGLFKRGATQEEWDEFEKESKIARKSLLTVQADEVTEDIDIYRDVCSLAETVLKHRSEMATSPA